VRVRGNDARGRVIPVDESRLPPRVVRERCPLCNAPPHDALCAHGWDGETTRAMRARAAVLLASAGGAVACGVAA
jgi:hypothetical protein